MEDLRKMLKDNMVVEFEYEGERRIGVYLSYARLVKTSFGEHPIEPYGEDLYCSAQDYVTKIYENTNEGLKLIWDRKKDFIKPVDWSKYDGIKNDVKVLVRSGTDERWKPRYFSHVDERGFVHTWNFGSNGWCSNYDLNHTKSWEQAVLYEGNEHLLESKEEN